jgi:hypothetical protein
MVLVIGKKLFDAETAVSYQAEISRLIHWFVGFDWGVVHLVDLSIFGIPLVLNVQEWLFEADVVPSLSSGVGRCSILLSKLDDPQFITTRPINTLPLHSRSIINIVGPKSNTSCVVHHIDQLSFFFCEWLKFKNIDNFHPLGDFCEIRGSQV